jgi:tRNA(fMet)-specific endonuclease VapC
MAERRLAFVDYVLDLFPVIDFDLTIARQHAAIWATLEMQGQLIGAHDLLIAATARTLTYGVITTNEREFRRIADLVVLNPL